MLDAIAALTAERDGLKVEENRLHECINDLHESRFSDVAEKMQHIRDYVILVSHLEGWISGGDAELASLTAERDGLKAENQRLSGGSAWLEVK